MMGRPLHRRRALQALGAGVWMAGTVRVPARAAEAYTMRLSLPNATASIPAAAALRFAAAVNRRSGGQLQIEVYPNGQLAKEQESIDALTSGVIDLAIQQVGFLTSLVPQFQVFDLPFLFKDAAASYRVLDGPIGDELFATLDPKGIVGLGWGSNGFKEFETTARAVVNVADMKGLRIRILGGAIFVATYQALGAIPVTFDLSEVFTALTQRTLDGIDVAIAGFASGKYYTVCKHVAMSNHVLAAIPLLSHSKRKMTGFCRLRSSAS